MTKQTPEAQEYIFAESRNRAELLEDPRKNTLLNQFRLLFAEMRPREWTKNLLLLAGLLFSGRLFYEASVIRAIVAFAAFCFASSAVYIMNDFVDIHRDRVHPVKRMRPLASGKLSPVAAKIGLAANALLAFALALTLYLLPLGVEQNSTILHIFSISLNIHSGAPMITGDPYSAFGGSNTLFLLFLAVYLALQVLYTFALKHIILLDIFTIAAGFALRAYEGAIAVAAPISPWLYVCALLLALFLGFGKRRSELVSLNESAALHRPLLKQYSLPMIDQFIGVITAAMIMAYSLYTFEGGIMRDQRMMLTIPAVIYGLFRYMYLTNMRGQGGSPADVLLRDRHIQGAIFVWLLVIFYLLYFAPVN